MPVNPTYPGVYIEEIPSGVHTITGVSTSTTAFIGRALRGTTNQATTINSYADFERIFGGLWVESTLGYAVQDFFTNGGSQAVIVRLFSPTDTDLKNARQTATAVSSATDPTKPSTAQTLADTMKQLVDSQPTRATKEAAQAVAIAAEAEAARTPSPDSVRQAATTTVDTLNAAAQRVASVTDPSVTPAANTTAMNNIVTTMSSPGKTAGGIVATKAADAATKANSTTDDVIKAANDAVRALTASLQTLVNNAPDATNPPTPQSTATAIRKAADAVTDPNKAAANLVALAAEQESSKPTLNSAKTAATNAASAYIANLPVTRAKLTVGGLPFIAASQGSWGANLRLILDINNISVDVANNLSIPQDKLFNITILDASPGGRTEQFPAVTVIDHPRRIDRVLQAGSQLLRWGNLDADGNPVPPIATDMPQFSSSTPTFSDPITTAEQVLTVAQNTLRKDRNLGKDTTADKKAVDNAQLALLSAVKDVLKLISDGEPITENEFTGPGTAENKLGLYALEQVDLFNLLVIPPYHIDSPVAWNVDDTLITDAVTYCEKRRAILLVDAPSTWIDKDTAKTQFTTPPDGATDIVSTRSKNAVLFFPRIKRPNVLRNNQLEMFAASGMIAGIFARTDAQRGVWKAPAGVEATLVGAQELSVNLTDAENGELNPLGINCLRAFPIYGRVVWGSRTLRGADAFADDYKYIPVRRTALFIEESLYRGTKWVVFEPNDEPLWAQIRLNVGAFMQDLFRKGAFQGQTPKDAYLVKCDKETTTQDDINLGIVNIVVGFAPLKPAEFVIIQLQQIAGQIAV